MGRLGKPKGAKNKKTLERERLTHAETFDVQSTQPLEVAPSDSRRPRNPFTPSDSSFAPDTLNELFPDAPYNGMVADISPSLNSEPTKDHEMLDSLMSCYNNFGTSSVSLAIA
jgi:hypothetical protein